MPKTTREIIEDYERQGASMKQKWYSEKEVQELKKQLSDIKENILEAVEKHPTKLCCVYNKGDDIEPCTYPIDELKKILNKISRGR